MTEERKTIDCSKITRPIKRGPIYLAIEEYKPEFPCYREGDLLEFLNTKPVWAGYYPEEAGYTYQSLCQYINRNKNCTGGMKVDETGKVTLYSLEQLIEDHDPSEEI